MAKIVKLRPDGPLAVSYRRGQGERRLDCRYDAIYATPDIAVRRVSYLYREAVSIGCDHALVIADLDLGPVLT
jgi:hypothetical protein